MLPSRLMYYVAAMLMATAMSVFLSVPAHAHSELAIEAQASLQHAAADNEAEVDWIQGHCHGGPSCTGAMFLSSSTRPDGVGRQSRSVFAMSELSFVGRLPARDPPVPICFL